MAQTHALIEQNLSESESSLEENPLFSIQEHVFPQTELHDQAKTNLKEKITKQGSCLSARIRGIPESGSLFRSSDSSQQPPRRTKKGQHLPKLTQQLKLLQLSVKFYLLELTHQGSNQLRDH